MRDAGAQGSVGLGLTGKIWDSVTVNTDVP